MRSLPSDQPIDYYHSLSESQNARLEQAQSLALLLVSGHESDLAINCKGQTFHVHSLIMCSRSDYFAIHRDASTRFPASDPHHVHLPEEDPVLIEQVIRFIYSASTTHDNHDTYGYHVSSLPTHASMYALGEFYGIRSLKWVAAGQFKDLIKGWPREFNAEPNLVSFIRAIKIVYTNDAE